MTLNLPYTPCLKKRNNLFFVLCKLQTLEMSASSVYQDLSCQKTENEWTDLNHSVIKRVVVDVSPEFTCLHSCWRQTFRAHDVKMM